MNEKAKHLFEIHKEGLPNLVPIFPLDNVLLLPFGNLPLNMFEPVSYTHLRAHET